MQLSARVEVRLVALLLGVLGGRGELLLEVLPQDGEEHRRDAWLGLGLGLGSGSGLGLGLGSGLGSGLGVRAVMTCPKGAGVSVG